MRAQISGNKKIIIIVCIALFIAATLYIIAKINQNINSLEVYEMSPIINTSFKKIPTIESFYPAQSSLSQVKPKFDDSTYPPDFLDKAFKHESDTEKERGPDGLSAKPRAENIEYLIEKSIQVTGISNSGAFINGQFTKFGELVELKEERATAGSPSKLYLVGAEGEFLLFKLNNKQIKIKLAD